jgi:hypothetical protein
MSAAALRSLSGKGAAFAAALMVASFVVLGATSTPAPDPVAGTDENRYIGAAQCRNCHKSPAAGNQYGKWESVKHSDAFVTLGTDAAKEVAKKAGVTDPQKDAKCLKCHVTGAGEPPEKFASTFEAEMGVQCESCHGAGEYHKTTRFAAAADAKPGERMTVDADEINSHPSPQGCLTCHNKESPTYKPFCFARFQAEIRHLDPRKTRTPEEQAKIDETCGCGETCTCDGSTSAGCGAAPSK